jgi:hypothetical protein
MMQFQVKLTATELVKVLEQLKHEGSITELQLAFDPVDKALNVKFNIQDSYMVNNLIPIPTIPFLG